MEGLAVAIGAIMLTLAGAGAYAGYRAGGKGKKGLVVAGVGAVAVPAGFIMYSRWASKRRGRVLRACIDQYCNQNPSHCRASDRDGTWYINAQYNRVCFG